MFSTHELTLTLDKYIAEPYWPEVEQVVNIQKASGFNRVRSEDKREATLRAYLEKEGMTWEEYQALVARSRRPWYRANGDDSPIIIPRHQLSGCLVQACTSAPAGARVPKGALRSLILLGDLETDRTQKDGVFSRFVRPCDGTGKPLSNQRSLRESEFIAKCEATGTVDIDTDAIKPEVVGDLLKYAGRYIGVGASRKMGYGRFTVAEFAPAPG